jgi:SAM-dependent methyltransferase
MASADQLPFDDCAFEVVICTEVLEHCERPDRVLREIHRVLAPGGRAFVTTPFMVALHEMPYDYYRFTPSSLQSLGKEAGLRIESLTPRGDYIAVMIALLAFPVSKMAQALSRRTGLSLSSPRNPAVYLSMVLPQRLYFRLWRRVREGRSRWYRPVYERLAYYTLGYVTVLARQDRA